MIKSKLILQGWIQLHLWWKWEDGEVRGRSVWKQELVAGSPGVTAKRLADLIPSWKHDILEAPYIFGNIYQGDMVIPKCISRINVIFQQERMVEEKRAIGYVFDSYTYPKTSNWFFCNHPGKDFSVYKKYQSFRALTSKRSAGCKTDYFCYLDLNRGGAKEPKNGKTCQDTERTHGWVSEGCGWCCREQGCKTSQVRAEHSVGTKPCSQPDPCLGAAQPGCHGAVQPIGTGQYPSLRWNKSCPVGLIQKAAATVSPQKLLPIFYLLSVIFYLISCWRPVMIRKCWVFLCWLQDSVQHSEIVTPKLIWYNSQAFTLSLVLTILILSA